MKKQWLADTYVQLVLGDLSATSILAAKYIFSVVHIGHTGKYHTIKSNSFFWNIVVFTLS